ncbi:MAG: cytidine deaminase [Chthoniobacterales bacterium]
MGAEIDWTALARQAWEARLRAHAPYSKFLVGAALLGASGEVFLGCNVENASFGLTICAEQAAVCAAIQGGCRAFSGIAIVAETENPVTPCGACRQVLAEFGQQLPIYAEGRGGIHALSTLDQLLPAAFTGKALGS